MVKKKFENFLEIFLDFFFQNPETSLKAPNSVFLVVRYYRKYKKYRSILLNWNFRDSVILKISGLKFSVFRDPELRYFPVFSVFRDPDPRPSIYVNGVYVIKTEKKKKKKSMISPTYILLALKSRVDCIKHMRGTTR